jgi:CSLREA domain-containing protein
MRSGPKRRVLSAIAVAAFATLACAATAGAESFAVTDTTDAPLSNSGAMACESTHESRCTLRAAVQAAENNGGASTIMDGRTYRTLPRDARSIVVSLVGLPRGPVTVRITGIASPRASYATTRVFHPCVPARPGARHLSEYLRRL